MNFRNNNADEDLSILGFGCMRFPKKGNSIDMAEVEKEILYAIEQGVNYFDTAYVYPGSEEALGKVLAKNNCRQKVKIATKLPHYLVKKGEDFERYFNEELRRLKTDHIDYYLMHMLPDVNVWNKLIGLGVLDWIKQKKENGQIKHIGFSYHGNTTAFIELLDAYDWEFCQIQYNYMDEHSQAGKKGLQAAAAKNIPVIIMEPLRGGSLAKGLPKKAEDIFAQAAGKRSPAHWALRWLWNQKEVTVVLSGMNSMAMLQENINIASEVQVAELTQADEQMFERVKEAINEKIKVRCTGCSYCMPCPFGVDIPGSFRCYNVSYIDRYFKGLMEYLMCTVFRNKQSTASLCQQCGACEKHCPQSISIRAELKNVKKRFENPIVKLASKMVKNRYK
jgi:predicted aldo/keto reductase-like oxidoreductase